MIAFHEEIVAATRGTNQRMKTMERDRRFGSGR
uniref:Uncharacterized protein n=1 Tax=Arundo donax TaxID=35708 RepID=A0A0A8Y137_ARUDO